MREISLSGGEPALRVYDTSGPPGCDVREGSPPVARALDRLAGRARDRPCRNGRPRQEGRPPRASRQGCTAPPAAATAPSPRCTTRGAAKSPPRWNSSRSVRGWTRASSGTRSHAGPCDHPRQHQPPRARAHDHRARLQGEDQRQHRELGGHIVHRRRGRQAPLGDAMGRGHGHGSVDREEHPRHARVDHPQLPRADRHRAHLPGTGKGRRRARGADLGEPTATRSSSSANRAWTISPCTRACCCATCR